MDSHSKFGLASSLSIADLRDMVNQVHLHYHLRDFHCFSVIASLQEPQTFHEASSNPLWQQVMKEEFDALHKTETWDLVDLPFEKFAIGCKWVYKIKTRSDDTVDCYKARLVVKGFT